MVIDMLSRMARLEGRSGKFEIGEYCCCTCSAGVLVFAWIVGSEAVRSSSLIFEQVTLGVAVDSPSPELVGRSKGQEELKT
jgi:hypothetical protein